MLTKVSMIEGMKLKIAVKCGKIYLFPNHLFLYSIVIMFFSLFLTLTLKGKPFTGM